MPADDRLRFHDDQDIGPAGPDAAESSPEEPVQGGECRSWAFPLEHGNLLTKGQDLEGGGAAAAEEDATCGKDREEEFEHELPL